MALNEMHKNEMINRLHQLTISGCAQKHCCQACKSSTAKPPDTTLIPRQTLRLHPHKYVLVSKAHHLVPVHLAAQWRHLEKLLAPSWFEFWSTTILRMEIHKKKKKKLNLCERSLNIKVLAQICLLLMRSALWAWT